MAVVRVQKSCVNLYPHGDMFNSVTGIQVNRVYKSLKVHFQNGFVCFLSPFLDPGNMALCGLLLLRN